MDLELRGKVALVTGGSKGIGLRTAQRLADEGCDLGICGRTEAGLAAAEETLASSGVRVAAVRADVTEPDDARRFVEEAAARLGRIDILVNNVGGASGGNIMEATDADWRETFEINVFQVVRMIRLCVPHMRRAGGGCIINLASISGWEPQLAGTAQYGASKAALIFMTERLALELTRDAIRVNTVSPGSIIWDGGGWDSERKARPGDFAAYVAQGFPAGRLGRPEEVADAIAFLASPRANWINGRHIPVDGLEQPVPFGSFRPW